jgi:TRAP-type mannitol/chloroaromatic compound transport system substrate-binding protein
MDRRSFLKQAATAAVAAPVAAAAVSYPGKTTHAQTKFRWRLAHSFGPTAPVLGTSLPKMAEDLRVMSKGALDLKVFGAGELVPAFGVFDAVQEGSIQMMYSASYYWAGKVPATQFTCSVPFGMTPQQQNAWFYHGGGMDLWNGFYSKRGLKVFVAGNTGLQMGGWFRKEINSIDDYKGLKMRIPGLGGKVVAAVGGTVVLLPAQEIFPALERGVIDACEWVGPLYDFNLGLHQAAKYYYSPGWHEPGTANELTINLKAWNSLPKEIQVMIEMCAYKLNVDNMAEFDAKNNEYLDKILALGKVELRQFPAAVIKELHTVAEKINQEVADSDPDARKLYESYKKFRDGVRKYFNLSEVAYSEALRGAKII